jgi:GNAT superfamily N-acetyltransferase
MGGSGQTAPMLLSGSTNAASGPAVTIRGDLRPGDMEAIVAQHGQIYPVQNGVGPEFVAGVAASVQRAVDAGFPREREAVRIVEVDGRHVGSIALTDEGDGEATLRWVLLDPELRGSGYGRALIEEMVQHARDEGFTLLSLETFSELEKAAAIYRSLGFELVSSDQGPRWGRDFIDYRRYELPLR